MNYWIHVRVYGQNMRSCSRLCSFFLKLRVRVHFDQILLRFITDPSPINYKSTTFLMKNVRHIDKICHLWPKKCAAVAVAWNWSRFGNWKFLKHNIESHMSCQRLIIVMWALLNERNNGSTGIPILPPTFPFMWLTLSQCTFLLLINNSYTSFNAMCQLQACHCFSRWSEASQKKSNRSPNRKKIVR